VERDGEYQTALDHLNRMIGYRIRVSQCVVSQDALSSVKMVITWANDGIAPFYFDWIPGLRIVGSDASETILHLELKLQDLQPGEMISVNVSMDKAIKPKGMCTVYAGIIDPATGIAGIELAMDTAKQGYWYELLQLTASGKE
jgi:hypothetical protein